MVVGVWSGIAFAVVVLAAVMIAAVFSSRRKTQRRELTSRESKRDKLDIVPLTPSALSDFTARWIEVQNGFVDNPAAAVGVADRLVTELMRQRGYRADDFHQQVADISVDHPQVVEYYRVAHSIHTSHRHNVSTEQQRKAFVHYRALFDTLLETGTGG